MFVFKKQLLIKCGFGEIIIIERVSDKKRGRYVFSTSLV